MFKVAKYLGGRGAYPDAEIIKCSTSTIGTGVALHLSGGYAVKSSGSEAVEYVSAGKYNAAGFIPAYKVDKNMLFEANAHSACAVGTKYTLGTDGASVTSTSTSGTATVYSIDGATAVVFFE